MVVRQHGRVGAAVVATLGLLVCGTSVTGCAGGGAVVGDAPSGADAVRQLQRAAGALVRAGSSRTRTSMEMATGGTRVTIHGEGVYDYRARLGRLTVLLPRDPAGTEEHRPITELLSPGALFMKNRGAGVPADKWVRVDTATLSDGNLVTGGATDPYAAAQLLRGARSARYVGQAEVGGVPVRHYQGVADIVLAAQRVPAVDQEPFRAAAKGFATAEVPFDAYLDGQGRLRKVRHRFSFVNGRQRTTVAVASTTLLYGFGAPVVVRLPATRDIFAGKIAEQ
ncbi:hypothetical protein ACWEO4_33595 [Streptomyces sp. NPDC004393]|uniref:hypothetical protein n=1 Tax=Streptomyces sp. NPDC004533 TaxID=3154278 RepID=UPI0033A575E2